MSDKHLTEAAFEVYRNIVMRWLNTNKLALEHEDHVKHGWRNGFPARKTASEIFFLLGQCKLREEESEGER